MTESLIGIALLVLSASIFKQLSVGEKSVKSVVKTTHSERLTRHGGLEGYITYLYNLHHSPEVQAELRTWTFDRVKSEILKVSKSLGVEAWILYGVIHHESRLRPVGIYGDSIRAATSANSTAFGVGQIVSSTFDSISPHVDFEHWDLWRPDRGVLATGILLRSLLSKYDLETAMRKYAGTVHGGQKLLAYIQARSSDLA